MRDELASARAAAANAEKEKILLTRESAEAYWNIQTQLDKAICNAHANEQKGIDVRHLQEALRVTSEALYEEQENYSTLEAKLADSQNEIGHLKQHIKELEQEVAKKGPTVVSTEGPTVAEFQQVQQRFKDTQTRVHEYPRLLGSANSRNSILENRSAVDERDLIILK